jgi:hypothetical protein
MKPEIFTSFRYAVLPPWIDGHEGGLPYRFWDMFFTDFGLFSLTNLTGRILF